MVLQLELLILNNMGDATSHYHLVRTVLEQYLLLLERDYFMMHLFLLFLCLVFRLFILPDFGLPFRAEYFIELAFALGIRDLRSLEDAVSTKMLIL